MRCVVGMDEIAARATSSVVGVMKRCAVFVLVMTATTAASACVPWHRGDRVTMTGHLVSAELRTNEILLIRRIIRNGGSRPVYLHWGPGMPQYSMRDSLGRRACYTDGPFSLVGAAFTVSPRDSLPHDTQWPLRGLSNCGPGRYTVDASMTYSLSSTDSRGRGGTLHIGGLPLVIRDSSGTR